MKLVHNFGCMFVAGFYQELRDFYNKVGSNPIKVIEYDMKKQKWESKVRG